MAAFPEFELFSLLPRELQLKIWSNVETDYGNTHVHPIRAFRSLDLEKYCTKKLKIDRHLRPGSQRTSWLKWPHKSFKLKAEGSYSASTRPIHPTLHTCRDSRKVILRRFNLMFAFGTFINPATDVLFLDRSSTLGEYYVYPGFEACAELLRYPELLGSMKNLAFNVDNLESGGSSGDLVERVAELLKGHLWELSDIYFVHRNCTSRAIWHYKHNPTPSGCNIRFGDVGESTRIHGTEAWRRTQLQKYWTNTDPLDWIDGASCGVPRYHHVMAENIGLENDNEDGRINYRDPDAVDFYAMESYL